MNKKILNLLIAVCLLFTTMNVQAQSGDEPTPSADSGGMVIQDGVLTANPIVREVAPAIVESTQGEGGFMGMAGAAPPDPGLLSVPEALPAPMRPSWSGELLPLEPGETPVDPDSAASANELLMGGGDPCKPSHLVTINFDELPPQPASFINTVAMRSEYRDKGVIFMGSSATNGGAVLNDTTFSPYISGISTPNMLAFNIQTTMSDGGIPRTPETIGIMGKASYFEMKAASAAGVGDGLALSMQAFGENNVLLGSDSIVLTNSMQTLSVAHTDITFITFTTTAQVLVVDDINYLPQTIAQVINFDESSREDTFIEVNPLGTDYAKRGVTFAGSGGLNGGAVLNQISGFGVSGFSLPNFLAFNKTAVMANSGVPKPPEEIRFNMPVSLVQIYPASSETPGPTISMTAYNRYGLAVGFTSGTMKSKIQPMTVTGLQITRVVIDTTASLFILDDLIYRPENAVHVDFDDSLTQPAYFIDANPLRSEMAYCGVTFQGENALNGGAILNSSTFSWVSRDSEPNFLAFNSPVQMANGGYARLPEILRFDRPVHTVEFNTGGYLTGGGTLTAYAYDKNNNTVAYETIILNGALQPVRLTGNQTITMVVISSPVAVVAIDDLFFTRGSTHTFLSGI